VSNALNDMFQFTRHQPVSYNTSCVTGCSLYMIVYVCMYYMLVRLSGCLNHIKSTIIIKLTAVYHMNPFFDVINPISSWPALCLFYIPTVTQRWLKNLLKKATIRYSGPYSWLCSTVGRTPVFGRRTDPVLRLTFS